MPELVAETVETAMVLSGAEIVLGVEVRDVGDGGVLQALLDAMIARGR